MSSTCWHRPWYQSTLLYFALATLSAALVAAAFAIQGNVGFNLGDEGFLWYGTQRVMAGEIPIRDFMAYDPGRYYWSAAVMWLYGDDSVMALRGSVAIFQAIGLFVGLKLLLGSFSKPNIPFWLLTAVTLMIWMFPRHKLFDISISIGLVGTLSFLIQQPTCRRYFLTGLVVGLAMVFGRNHGIYGIAASLGIMAHLRLRNESTSPTLPEAFAFWAIGVVIGYLPVLFMLATIPGFAHAFWESILFLFEIKDTNLPLPLPWPWRVLFGQLSIVEIARGLLIGLYFIFIVGFGLIGIVWAVHQRLRDKPTSAAFVASAFLTLPYAHHAYSRADISHLAQGIFPFLLGSLVVLANHPTKTKWLLAALLCGSSLFVALPLHPGWQCYSSQRCVETDVNGSRLKVEPGTANDLALLNKLAEQFATDGRSFVATPYWPGSYAVLERKSPMWEIYALFPRNASFQHAEIERIRASNPGFVVINDVPLDGRNDFRFRNSHPIVDQFIRDNFEPLNDYSPNPSLIVYKSKLVTK